MRCPVCQEDLLSGHALQRFPPPQRLLPGPKSGVLGLYPHEDYINDPEDIVHYPRCFIGYRNPEDSPYLADAMRNELREEIEPEIREEVREEMRADFKHVKEMIGEKNYNFCVGCWKEVEDAEEPMCLWCKNNTAVWSRQTPGGPIHWCSRCAKMWNEADEEVSAA